MSDKNPLVPSPDGERILTSAEFNSLAEVPPEVEWFANIQNPNTRRAYQIDLRHFMRFTGIVRPSEFRIITRPHVIAWRKELEKLSLSPASIRRKLSALGALFDFLCDNNAITHNPVNGVKRPKEGANEGKAEPLTAADRHDLEYALNLLDRSKPECRGYLWNHYVIGFDYAEIAGEQNLNYDNVRMKIGRCLDEARSLVA